MKKENLYQRKGKVIHKNGEGFKTFDSANKAKKESRKIQKEAGGLGCGILSNITETKFPPSKQRSLCKRKGKHVKAKSNHKTHISKRVIEYAEMVGQITSPKITYSD